MGIPVLCRGLGEAAVIGVLLIGAAISSSDGT